MKTLLKLLPWCLLALFAVEIIAVMLPKKDGQFHTREFGRLPVLLNGRIQPLDSVASNALLQSQHRRRPRGGSAIVEILASPEETQVHRMAAGGDVPPEPG